MSDLTFSTPSRPPAGHDTLAGLGWDDGWAAALSDAMTGTAARVRIEPSARPGRVVRVDRGGCDVVTAAGPRRARLSSALLAAAQAEPVRAVCVGDWVVVADGTHDGDGPVVVVVLPRRSTVVRASVTPGTSRGQVLAANVDAVLVVEPSQPEPDLGRVERLLALAWESGATPVVVLTKVDLAGDSDQLLEDLRTSAPGAAVVGVSAVTGHGVGELTALLPPRATVVLLGPSGAGKSTLTNALTGADRMGTSRLRGDGKGRHTTVHRELVVLPGGVLMIDTPGLRAVGLLDAPSGIPLAFSDVEALATGCRFSDCGHTVEPGCAVLEAVEQGELPARRLESFRKLEREAAWMASRHDARLRAEQRNRWKQITKANRARPPR